MRCPKCQYIGLDEGERCRHCGYDFSMSEPDAPFDLPMRGDRDVDGPLADLSIASGTAREREPVRRTRPTPQAIRRAAAAGLDLPLFEDDAPLVTPPAVPRVPLSVRRTAPHTPRVPFEPDERELLDDLSAGNAYVAEPDIDQAGPSALADERALADVAPKGRRVLAALVDLAIVGAIDTAVIYFTLRVCNLTFADVRALPVVPLAAFLLMLNGGYATLFTAAGGQTIGKMLTGIRVVPLDSVAGMAPARVTVATAVARAAAGLVSLVPVGLGFIMGLVRADGRTLHDTLVHTRVVKA